MKNLDVPKLWKPASSRRDCELYLPYAPGNRKRVQSWIGHRSQLEFLKHRKTWGFKHPHFSEVVESLHYCFDEAVVVIDSRKNGQKCDLRCIEAEGFDCVCSCGGANHGTRVVKNDWMLVGETTLVDTGGETKRVTYRVGKRYSSLYRDQLQRAK